MTSEETVRDLVNRLERKIDEAAGRGIRDPNAMTLATVAPDGRPSARVVLYKGLVRGGLSFFTNFESRKGSELHHNPVASAVFFWPELHEQVRVDGDVARLTPQESEAYFRSRPRESQIGAWASAQSREISGMEELRERVRQTEERFAGQDVPCPPHWGGFHLIPTAFEFWVGQPGRLHERYCFEIKDGVWRSFMRSP